MPNRSTLPKRACTRYMGIFSLSYGGTEDPWYRAGNNLQQNFLASGLAMSATLLYRIAAVVFVLFAVGHTFGFLSFRPPSPEGRAVYDSMNNVHFQVGGKTFSYGNWYRGFGLTITVSMLFWAFLSWHLAGLAKSNPGAIAGLGWAFFAVQAVGVVFSLLYFGLPATVFSFLVAALVGAAAWLVGR